MGTIVDFSLRLYNCAKMLIFMYYLFTLPVVQAASGGGI